MSLEDLKRLARTIGSRYADREQRARRLFIEERAASLHHERHREFEIRTDISEFFGIPYSSVNFCGSGQLGFSISKNRLFRPAQSDLDVACVNVNLFQKAWIDVISTTRAFTDLTAFGTLKPKDIDRFKDQILRRGMIRIEIMPQSDLSRAWSQFEVEVSRKHTEVFRRISIAVYMNEYAFCWKQDSVLSELLGV